MRGPLSIILAAACFYPQAAVAGDFLGKSAATWARDLASPQAETRRSAAFALGRTGESGVDYLPNLLTRLRTDKDAGVREAAGTAVGDIIRSMQRVPDGAFAQAGPTLREALRDGSPKVRRSAAYALGTFGPEAAAALADLKAALRDDHAMVRQNAAWALGRLGKAADDETVDLLCTKLRDSDPLVCRDAATALGEIGLPRAQKAWHPLLELVRSEAGKKDAADDVLLRTAMAKLVVLMDNRSAEITRLLRALIIPDNATEIIEARNRALKNLGAIGLPDATAARETAIRHFHDAFKSGDAGAKVLAAMEEMAAKGKEENDRLAPRLTALEELLKHDDPDTAHLAAFVLARLGGPAGLKAISVLKGALNDIDPQIQEQAATFLGEMGPDAAPAVPALANALHANRAAPVRVKAALALANIGPEAVRVRDQLLEILRAPAPADGEANDMRPYIAEIFGQMGYPASRAGMPVLLDLAAKDKNSSLRQRCIWVFLNMKAEDFPEIRNTNGRTAEEVLTALLSDETLQQHLLVRYDAARVLAVNLRDKAPAKAVDVLLHMLTNKELKIYHGTDASVTNIGAEGTKGASKIDPNVSGDARFLAAIALGQMGTRANRKDVIRALKDAETDKDERLRQEAEKALKAIGP